MSFELHNGVLVYRPPVLETFHRSNPAGEIPVGLLSEYVATVHRQTGHSGIQNLVARTRRNVFCLVQKAIVSAAKAVCEQCDGCSVSKPAIDHRTAYGPIALPAKRGQAVGVDITLGCAHPRKLQIFPRMPWILSVTCRRVGYTQFRVMPNATVKVVASLFKNMLHWMGIAGTL